MSEKQYVVFRLNEEEYGVEINKVKEITEYKETTKIPNVPSFIEGIVNLRGTITPVINLKKRFNMEDSNLIKDCRTIIINVAEKQIGFIVDDASKVLYINEDSIQDPPDLIKGIDRQYITGIGKVDEKIVVLLDFEQIVSNAKG